jgi:ribosomal protein S18 acetylase RimI-like enzyme
MSLKLLEWDTKFFKKRIARLDVDSDNVSTYLNQLKNFDIVYIYSDSEIFIDAPLMDIKVTYSKRVLNVHSINEVIQFDLNKHDYDQLLELVYLSGHESRFLKDQSFGIKEFKRLYKKWIDNSIEDKDTIVLIHYDGVNIDGFVTVKNIVNNSQIGLIAVDREKQGRGIGRKLLDSVESIIEIGNNLVIDTQQSNQGASKFYESLGFKLKCKKYIYHYKSQL